MFDRIRHKLGLNRYTVETPAEQHQYSANKKDSGVRPALPSRSAPAGNTPMAPRGGLPPASSAAANPPAPGTATTVMASPTASPVGAVTPSPARSDTAMVTTQADSAAPVTAAPHPLLDAMKQGAAGLHGTVEHLFSHVAQSGFAKAALRHELQTLDRAMASAAPVDLPGAPSVLLAQSLAVATGGEISRALNALAALRQLDPVADIAATWHRREEPEIGNELDKLDAWRVVMELGTTPSGMRVLQTILGQPVAPAHKEDFELMLKTTAEMAKRDATLATPGLALDSPNPPTEVLGDAIACVAAKLAGDMEAAHPKKWALNSVRNDMFDIGPGTRFATVEARILKMGNWIDHATGDRTMQVRNPLKAKSAFRALRHGAQQVDRGTSAGKHRQAFDAALRRAASQLRDQLTQMAPLAKAGGPGRAPTELFRAAVLDHCLAAPAGQWIDNHQFDAAAIDDIALRLASLLAEAGGQVADPSHQLLEQLKGLPELKALGSGPFRMEDLAQWVDDAVATHASLPGAEPGAAPSWAEGIGNELKAARREVEGHDTRLPRVTREGMRGALKHIVSNIEGSSRLRLASGGIVGVGLRQISAAITALSTAFLLRGRVDARRQWGRQAVFEIAMPPYDMEVMIATQRQKSTQFGLGVFVGPDLEVVKAGGNFDFAAYAKESADLEGVTLRLPRIGRPVSELRTEFAALVDRLMDGTTAEARAGDGSLLKQLLQEFPLLTVNQVGQAGDERTRHGASAEAVASVQGLGMRAGVSAGVAVELQRGVVRHYEDVSGSMQVVRHIEGWGVRAGVGGRIAVGPTVDAGPVSLTSGNTDTVLLGGTADLLVAGAAGRREEVYVNGRLHPISFRETEHQNLDAFLEEMKPRRDEWVETRLAAPDTQREAGAEHVELQRFLDEITEQNSPTHTFAARSTITLEAAERIDAYHSTAQLAERLVAASVDGGSVSTEVRARAQSTQQAAAQKVEDEWATPASVRPYSLRAYERASSQSTVGLNLIAQFGAQHTADASHIDNRLDAA
jgi:hypothetical protein